MVRRTKIFVVLNDKELQIIFFPILILCISLKPMHVHFHYYHVSVCVFLTVDVC